MSIKKRKRRNLAIISGIVLMGCFWLVGELGFREKTNKVVAGEIAKDENVNGDDKKLNEVRYLPLEEDEFADDVKVVEKNLKDLITGKRTFPVRDDNKKVVYLTFDDGPSTTVTPEILKVLKEENIKATFFVLGSSVDKSEESKAIIKEIVKGGHAIGNHTYSHDYKKLYPGNKINAEYLVKELDKTNESIKKILGDDFNSRVVRLPGGYWSWNGREKASELLHANEYYNVDWNALNGDSEGNKISSDKLLKNLKDTVNAAGNKADNLVVLMHDTYGKENTAKTLKESIQFLKSEGFEFRTMK